jgi:hypothetical protein
MQPELHKGGDAIRPPFFPRRKQKVDDDRIALDTM